MSILVDRSRIETDWACARKRYWLTEYTDDLDGPVHPARPIGIVPSTPSPALAFGLTVHEGLEYQILEYTRGSHSGLSPLRSRWVPSQENRCPPEEAGLYMMKGHGNPLSEQAKVWDTLTPDQQDTAQALIIGFFKTIWPRWMEQYEPMAVEQELEMEVDGVIFMMRPDLLLKDKQTGDIWYPDFKTFTSWNNRKWDWGLQQQLTMLACEKALGVTLTGAWIQGLSKGSGRKGVLYHPLVYGYRHPGTPGVTDPTFGSKRRSGFERFHTWDYPYGGIEGWIDRLADKDPELLSKCYPQTAPLFLKKELMEEEIIPQVVAREKQIEALRLIHGATPDEHRKRFPMNINQCETGYGRCSYFEACHVPAVHRHPLKGGGYKPRHPHHKAEQDIHELLSGAEPG